ncbi:MAG TPA: malic enzyme-like NAD(P)-binding protein, partial [Solirubrobacterales bacterium]|nr:malic enzyme-like NAD(P)-binding protein [Solirubrobacterales bacterium]
DAFPICLDTHDTDEIVRTVELLAPAFGGINLEDISAPRCFEIEDRLKASLDIPVFHDDQHGTAVVVLAALLNACKLTGRSIAGTRVLVVGLGNIGPEAAMPVMEGKAMLFKEFAEVDAFPICLDTQDTEEIIKAVELIAPTFGGINLEDISAPRCFEIEDRLKESIDIPVFHDDQHGTAVVTMAALFNALKITGKPIEELRVLVVGLGAAGVAVTKMMLASGITQIVGCDRQGALSTERADYQSGEMNEAKRWYAEHTNPEQVSGSPDEAIEGMDIFVGLSGPGIIEAESLGKMNDDAIVFAMANPTPEVMPEDAAPYVRIMATGRSDYPNQINNVLAFPGIFRGALDAGAPSITEEMKLAAATGIAMAVSEADLAEDYIIPSVFNRDVAPKVAEAVVEEAKRDGIARLNEETGTFATVEDAR